MYADYYVYVFMCMYVTDSPGLELPPPQFSPTVGELELVREDFFFLSSLFPFLFSFLLWVEYLLSNYSNSITFFIFEITLTWV